MRKLPNAHVKILGVRKTLTKSYLPDKAIGNSARSTRAAKDFIACSAASEKSQVELLLLYSRRYQLSHPENDILYQVPGLQVTQELALSGWELSETLAYFSVAYRLYGEFSGSCSQRSNVF